MLDEKLAQKLVAKIRRYTEFDINIMNQKGIIIASTKDERVGSFHEVAYKLIKEGKELLMVDEDDHFLGTQPGVNMSIVVNGEVEGVVGISGRPAETYNIVYIVKMAVESLMEYEFYKEEVWQRQNKDKLFLNMLLYNSMINVKEVEDLAKELHYNIYYIRVPIVFEFATNLTASQLSIAIQRTNAFDHQSIITISREDNIVIFKSLDAGEFMMYKDIIQTWITQLTQELGKEVTFIRAGVGTLQNEFHGYRCAYEHACWVKEHHQKEGIYFFMDELSTYSKQQLPDNFFYDIFNIYDMYYDEHKADMWQETLRMLETCNYNINEAAKRLNLHRNTLIFRLNKIKTLFAIDPVNNHSDAVFLENLVQFYARMHKQKR